MLAVSTASPLCAGPVLDVPELWTNGLAGWTNVPPQNPVPVDTAITNPGAGGVDSDGYLRIVFSSQGGPPAPEDDTIYTISQSYTGNYQLAGLTLRFAFYAEDILPLAAGLYLHSAISDSTWDFAFNNTAVGSWTWHSIPFNYDAGWSGWGGAADFWNDLANIDWIGVNIARAMDTMQQDYGIDSWRYYIPEPGGLSMLAVVALSSSFTFRKLRRKRFACFH